MPELQRTVKYSRSREHYFDEESRRYERKEPAEYRSSASDRAAVRAAQTPQSTVPREYATKVRAASPGLPEADVERLHGHIPVEYAASALRRGMTVDQVIEAYQEHAPRSAVDERRTYERPAFIPSRQPTRASQLAAGIERLAQLGKR